jgi:hypothetical protein
MSKWSEAPMSLEVRELMLGTKLASVRRPLAKVLADFPISYNNCLKLLKAAPKNSPEANDFCRGQDEARRLLGKE